MMQHKCHVMTQAGFSRCNNTIIVAFADLGQAAYLVKNPEGVSGSSHCTIHSNDTGFDCRVVYKS